VRRASRPQRKVSTMTLYATLLYYPADNYWTTPEERVFTPGTRTSARPPRRPA